MKTLFGSHTGSISCLRGSGIVQTAQTGVTPKRFQFAFTSKAKAIKSRVICIIFLCLSFLCFSPSEVFYDFQYGSQSKSHSKHCCSPKSILYLFCKRLHIIKRRTNELLNFIASVFVTSSQKRVKKVRKKRNKSDFRLDQGELVNGGRIFLTFTCLRLLLWWHFFRFFLRSRITIDLCDRDLLFLLSICFDGFVLAYAQAQSKIIV